MITYSESLETIQTIVNSNMLFAVPHPYIFSMPKFKKNGAYFFDDYIQRVIGNNPNYYKHCYVVLRHL